MISKGRVTLSSLWISVLSFGVIGSFGAISGCGTNVFNALEEENAAEEAAKALERQNPQQAVNIALKALGSAYRAQYFGLDAAIEDGETEEARVSLEALVAQLIAQQGSGKIPQLISVLSSAHAKIYGIDPLDLALALATDQSSAGQTSLTTAAPNNDLAVLFPVLPDATTENINGLTGARLILDSMGNDAFTEADFFKKALYLTANVSLLSKQLDTDQDGSISVLEAANLSSDNAAIVLDLLLDAATSAGGTGETGDDSKAASSAAKITSIRAAILNGEGADDTEKVKNYLGSSSTTSTTSTTQP